MAVTAAIIAGASSVGSQMLANRNQPRPNAATAPLGNASQMVPQTSALAGITNTSNPNPAFGQFLGGGL